MKSFPYFIAITMAVLLLSCDKNASKNNTVDSASISDIELSGFEKNKAEEGKSIPNRLADTIAGSNGSHIVLQAGQPVPPMDWDKKIIKTANITVELKDYYAYNQVIHNNTKRYGAYIAAEQQTEQDGRLQNTITIKVPVEQFEPLLNALPADGAKVIQKSITSEDVTGEVVDTKSRMEAKKKVRDRYLELLGQAKNMKDILEVQNEINDIQEGIELAAGRVNYLVHQSAYSTINLTCYQLITTETPIDHSSFYTRVHDAFFDGVSIVSGLLVLLITFWPLLIAGLCVWLWINRRYSRRVKVGQAN